MQKKSSNQETGQLRIIAGKWRGRRFNFPVLQGLRPTSDRIRETLFNWLMPYIKGARCLDLFAGSGALSLEALSRGAQHVTVIDKVPRVIQHIGAICKTLSAENVELCCIEIPGDLNKSPPYDIVFLDPPFHKGLIEIGSQWLEDSNLLADAALIYIETERTLAPLPLPKTWKIHKSGTAGQVAFYLAKRDSEVYTHLSR